MKKTLDRRTFILGGGALGAAAAGSIALASCAPQTVESEEAPKQELSDDFVMDAQKADAKWSFEIPPEPIPEDQITETVEADVIVVGAGTSGLCTAVSAAEQGLSVTLISASKAPVSRGGSNFAVNSKIMEREGIPPVDIDSVANRERMMASNNIDQNKWMRFLNNSEESMNWLVDLMENHGVQMTIEMSPPEKLFPKGDIQHVSPAAHAAIDENTVAGIGQPLIVNALAEILQELGGTVVYRMKAEQLIRDDNNTGRVSAVIAQNLQEETYVKYVGTKAIVLATGDFSADKEMMRKYCPSMLSLIADDAGEDYDIGLYTKGLFKGEGHKMGLWVGAGWQHTVPNAPMVNVAQGTAAHAFCGHCGLALNVNGERFSNELAMHSFTGRAVLMQPEGAEFPIWGTNYAEDNGPWYVDGSHDDEPLSAEEMLASWDADAEAGYFTKADTLEELIDALGLPKEKALASIERYNELCEKGVDEDFHKRSDQMIPVRDAPFYGMRQEGRFLTVLGGLRTNVNLQVCQGDDTPIEGLYNVGTMVGDFASDTYTFLMEGLNYGSCITFGYLLGRDLAKL